MSSQKFYTVTLALFLSLCQTLPAQVAESGAQSSLRGVCERVLQSVVTIETRIQSPSERTSQRKRIISETGIGFALTCGKQTAIVTNYHVVANVPLHSILLTLHDLQFTRPTKIIASEEFDVAVLLTDTELIPVTIGNSDTVEVTDTVLSIGNPFGLRESVSAGIISAKNRLSLPTGNQKLPLQGFFQTDAQINPGNSGGPLLTTDGKVIGMVTAIASAGGQNEGIAFAIPINSIVNIATQLLENGFIVRPQIGLELDTDFDLEARINAGFRRIVGTRIKNVIPNGAAYAAGMIPGDIITRVGKTEVLSDEHFIQLVARSAVGSKLDIEIVRKGQMLRCRPVVSSVNVQGKVTLAE